jgi:hypothetical protein
MKNMQYGQKRSTYKIRAKEVVVAKRLMLLLKSHILFNRTI